MLDSAAVTGYCFLTGVDCEVRPSGIFSARLTFSKGVPSSLMSLGAKHGRHERSPPVFLALLLVEPSRWAAGVVGRGGAWAVLSGWLVGCPERLLLAVLPALRLPMKLRLECFDPFPMLSASAAVTPLSPVPEGAASFAFEGTFSWGCLPSAVEETIVCEPGNIISN